MLALCIESSHSRGLGHLFRSLHLADRLRERGHDCFFLVNNHSFALQTIHSRGYRANIVSLEDQDSNWEKIKINENQISCWVNDRLDTTAQHGAYIKAMNVPLVTFDDKGEGACYADLHIAALAPPKDIKQLEGHNILSGIEYLILNPEINRYQRKRDSYGSIMISMGGSDTHGVTIKIIKILADLGKPATIVLGPAFEHYEQLSYLVSDSSDSFIVKQQVPSLIAEFVNHDLAITGGGITSYEAAASGLPTIIIANETFEIPTAKLLATLGCSIFAGHHENIDKEIFSRKLPIAAMSECGLKQISLKGIDRVIDAMEKL